MHVRLLRFTHHLRRTHTMLVARRSTSSQKTYRGVPSIYFLRCGTWTPLFPYRPRVVAFLLPPLCWAHHHHFYTFSSAPRTTCSNAPLPTIRHRCRRSNEFECSFYSVAQPPVLAFTTTIEPTSFSLHTHSRHAVRHHTSAHGHLAHTPVFTAKHYTIRTAPPFAADLVLAGRQYSNIYRALFIGHGLRTCCHARSVAHALAVCPSSVGFFLVTFPTWFYALFIPSRPSPVAASAWHDAVTPVVAARTNKPRRDCPTAPSCAHRRRLLWTPNGSVGLCRADYKTC